MTVQELFDKLRQVIDDGNGSVEIVGGLDGGLKWNTIKYVEIYDEPVYIVLGEDNG